MQKQTFWKLASALLLLCLIIFVTTAKINLTTADLGRHLINGELLVKQQQLLTTNLYSYTNPAYPVVTHHWLGSLFLYSIWTLGNFNILSLFYILVTSTTFLFIFLTAKKNSNIFWATIATTICLPLIAYRTEIRPEIFSYLFSSIFINILNRYRGAALPKHALIILGLIQLIWVNTHILFFVGPGLVGIYLVDTFIKKRKLTKNVKRLALSLALVTSMLFVNPFGIRGALIPLTIFNNFGYRLLENQTVWFIEKLIHNPLFTYYKIAFTILLFSFILNIGGKDRKWLRIDHLLTGIIVSVAGWFAIRNFALFGYFAIPILSYNFHYLTNSYQTTLPSKTTTILTIFIGLILLLTVNNKLAFIFPKTFSFGLGLYQEINRSADFFKKNKISGPVFNNYDIGGYLIYHIYPEEKVFVDNRPEAYPADFFQNIYIPMQENEKIWNKYSKEYNFNSIFFMITDATPWGQNFLIQRVKDPTWIPVYADQFAIIFLKDNDKNKKTIGQHQLPNDYFNIR